MKQQFSEAIKLKDGQLYNLPYHQARVDNTLFGFGGEPIDLAEALSKIPEYVLRGLFKCRVVYGAAGVESIEFIPYSYRRIETVGLVEANDIEYDYKYTDRRRLNALLEQSGCDDIIIVRNGLVADAFAANLVFQSAEGLFTPDTPLLLGTKRQSLLDKGAIREKRITADDMVSYDRVYFINALIDLEDEIYVHLKNSYASKRLFLIETCACRNPRNGSVVTCWLKGSGASEVTVYSDTDILDTAATDTAAAFPVRSARRITCGLCIFAISNGLQL